ncbi:MAG: hypothetical protein RL208_229, partial [Pseudomonadota bacterium]
VNDIVNDNNYIFWIHTIKKQRKIVAAQDSSVKYVINSRISQEYQLVQNQINNYKISVYITICRKNIKQDFTFFQEITNFFISSSYNITKPITKLQEITTKVVSELKQYTPKILGIVEKNGSYYSELVAGLSNIIHLSDAEYKLDNRDVSKILNQNRYLFGSRFVAIRKPNNEICFSTSFSLKEIPNIPINVIVDILGIHSDIVISEYFNYVNNKVAKNYFKERLKFLSYLNDQSFNKLSDFDDVDNMMDSSRYHYVQSSVSFTIFADSAESLHSCIDDVHNMFSKYGIIAAMEDISLDRNYYALMPTNYPFVHRLKVANSHRIGTFCYSYLPKEPDMSIFLNNKFLFALPTLKLNPVLFGLTKERSNIIISGGKNAGKTTLSNFIVSKIASQNDVELFIIETQNKSRTFVESLNGSWNRVSLDKMKHTCNFNPFEVAKYISDKYLVEFLSLLTIASNSIISPDISYEISNIINHCKTQYQTGKKFAIHDIRSSFANTKIEREIDMWHSVGKYYHIFDNREDTSLSQKKVCYYLDETIQKNPIVLTNIVNHLINSAIFLPVENGKKRIVVIEEPFFIFGHNFFKSSIEKFVNEAKKRGIIIIFKISDIQAESATIVDFSDIILNSATQIHFANKDADDNYGRIFKLEKFEYYAVQTLRNYKNSLLIKRFEETFSCYFNLSYFQKTLSILSDNEDIRMKILGIKEALQTDDAERWIPAFYADYDIIHGNIDYSKQDLEIIAEAEKILNN